MDELRVAFTATAPGFRMHPFLVLILFTVSGAASACGGSPTAPNPPVSGPQISCPANLTVRLTATSHAVSYPPPATTGGQPPVNVSCAPASESVFSAGVTSVTCSATDAAARVATCGFSVTLRRFPNYLFRRSLLMATASPRGRTARSCSGTRASTSSTCPTRILPSSRHSSRAATPGRGLS